MSVATNMRRADLYYCGTGFEALKCYVIDAEKGNKAALDTLSDIYEYGKSRLKKELGDIYYNGLGVEQNCPEGVKWYIKAAKKVIQKPYAFSAILLAKIPMISRKSWAIFTTE